MSESVTEWVSDRPDSREALASKNKYFKLNTMSVLDPNILTPTTYIMWVSLFEGSVAINVLEEDWYYIIISLDLWLNKQTIKNGAKAEITTNGEVWENIVVTSYFYYRIIICLPHRVKGIMVVQEMLQTKFSLKKLWKQLPQVNNKSYRTKIPNNICRQETNLL